MIFVDGVVAEVHTGVPQILSSVVVLHCGEPEIICEAKPILWNWELEILKTHLTSPSSYK